MKQSKIDLRISEFLMLTILCMIVVLSCVAIKNEYDTRKILLGVKREIKYTVVEKERLVIPCRITSYNATKGQCDSKPMITADGHKIKSTDSIVGVSRDIMNYTNIKFGDTVIVWTPNHKGRYVVHDLGNNRLEFTTDVLLFDNNHFSERGYITITK